MPHSQFERLVVEYNVSDGCTYGYAITLPILYESPEAFLVDFDTELTKAYARYAGERTFNLGGQNFNADDFRGDNASEIPEVMTLSEWFASVQSKSA
jgi:hypothetical protein